MPGGRKDGKTDKAERDDDEFLDECIKANGLCAEHGCKKSVKVINIKCNLCNSLFCTTHALPEVHGCGKAAKQAAAKPKKAPISEKRTAQLENSLSKKLEKMRNERKKTK